MSKSQNLHLYIFLGGRMRGNLPETHQQTMFCGYVWPILAQNSHKNLGAKSERVRRLDQVECRRKLLKVTLMLRMVQWFSNGNGMHLRRRLCTNKSWLVAWYSFSLRVHKTNLGMLRGKSWKQLDALSYHLFESIWVCILMYSLVSLQGLSVSHPSAWASKNLQRLCSTETSFHAVTLLSGLLHCSTCSFMIFHILSWSFHGFQMFSVSFLYFPLLSIAFRIFAPVKKKGRIHKTKATLLRKFRRVPIAVHSLLGGLPHAMCEEHTNQ